MFPRLLIHNFFAIGFLAGLLLPSATFCGQFTSLQTPSEAGPSVMVDVIAIDKHRNAPAEGLSQEDFRILDNRGGAAISSFSNATGQGSLRPLSLWFIVQCPEQGAAYSWVSNGSGFLKGKSSTLTPILQTLSSGDTVGVAHWCDDATYGIDLLPTADRNSPVTSLDTILNKPLVPIDTTPGEDALHGMINRLLEISRQATPHARPVLVFFYGDHAGMFHDSADQLAANLLASSSIVYCINNGAVSVQQTPITSQQIQMFVVHFFAEKTGGQVLSNWHSHYDAELLRILAELRGRYQIGVVPAKWDNSIHTLQVKLSDSARSRSKSIELRSPYGFLAAPPSPDSSDSKTSASLAVALKNSALLHELPFDVSGKSLQPGQPCEFRFYIDPAAISWTPADTGDRGADITLAVAGISTDGGVLAPLVKRFQAVQVKADYSGTSQKALILNSTFPVPIGAIRIRFVLRDAASGRLGSFELPVASIRGFTTSAAGSSSPPQ